ncbi:MAG: DUF465 domain-containing protein [Rhodobacteraceae bacterium]|nr:DUF465 domain-containing protein [Paracoccaceae bacterium]
MNLNAHLTELQKKHEKLENQIEKTQRHPSADTIEIGVMKKEKLRIKEEIARVASRV